MRACYCAVLKYSPVLLFPLLAFPGCSRGPTSTSFSVQDSAGIRIVETHQLAWEADGGWSVSPEPVLEIGERDGRSAFQFFEITGGLRLPDGRIAILNSGSSTVRIFGEDGRFINEFGGSGDGPGEFRSLGSIHCLLGDTLLVWDGRRPGFSLFSSSGEFIRSQRLTRPGSELLAGVEPLPGGRLVVKTYASPETQGGVDRGIGIHRDLAPLFLFSLDGTLLDTIGVFPSTETMIMELGGGTGTGVAPFWKAMYVGVDGNSLYVGTAERLEVSVLDASGDSKELFRYPGVDLTVGEGDREWYRDRMMEMASTPQEQQMMPMILENVIYPESRAAYTDLKTDQGGGIWLRTGRRFPISVGSPEWTVVSEDGVFLGKISLPERFEPLEFGVESILGVWKDEMDVEYIRVYSIEK